MVFWSDRIVSFVCFIFVTGFSTTPIVLSLVLFLSNHLFQPFSPVSSFSLMTRRPGCIGVYRGLDGRDLRAMRGMFLHANVHWHEKEWVYVIRGFFYRLVIKLFNITQIVDATFSTNTTLQHLLSASHDNNAIVSAF